MLEIITFFHEKKNKISKRKKVHGFVTFTDFKHNKVEPPILLSIDCHHKSASRLSHYHCK